VLDLRDYSARQWLKLDPLVHAFKQARNDLVQAAYLRRQADGMAPFLRQLEGRASAPLACVIAFERPWVTAWQIRMARRYFEDTTLVVLDNSRNPARRAEVLQVCSDAGVPCLALPPNGTRHVNRSHGMALSWTWHNVIRPLQPEVFAFLDHDLLPLKRVSLRERIGDRPLFGLLRDREHGWHLWAGYSVFRYDAVRGLVLNFLYDFSRDLDTGGRNWRPLYRHYNRAQLRFARRWIGPLSLGGETRQMEVIDDRWLHLGGVGYNDNFSTRADFFGRLAAATDAGATLTTLLSGR